MKAIVYEENEKKKVEFTLSKQELVALLAHSSKDAARPFMSAVAFDTEKLRVMATDGHRAALCQCAPPLDSSTGQGKTYILPRVFAEDVAKRLKGSEEATFRFDDAGNATVSTTMGSTSYKLSEAQFPPIDQVIPKYDAETKSCSQIGFNAFYLADLELVGKATGGKQPKLVMTLGPTAMDPALMKVESFARGCEWTVVLMPMRIE